MAVNGILIVPEYTNFIKTVDTAPSSPASSCSEKAPTPPPSQLDEYGKGTPQPSEVPPAHGDPPPGGLGYEKHLPELSEEERERIERYWNEL